MQKKGKLFKISDIMDQRCKQVVLVNKSENKTIGQKLFSVTELKKENHNK